MISAEVEGGNVIFVTETYLNENSDNKRRFGGKMIDCIKELSKTKEGKKVKFWHSKKLTYSLSKKANEYREWIFHKLAGRRIWLIEDE